MNVLPPSPVKNSGRELGGVKKIAEMCDCSTRHIRRLADSGKMPKPIRLGGLVKWDLSQIEQWLSQGCPSVRNMKGVSQ